MNASLTARLVHLIRQKPVTADDLAQAARFTLDAIANALAGRQSEPGRILQQWAAGAGRDAGRRAFLMGALTHILETDDIHRESVVHPGCVVVPAAWALAEREGLSGHAFLRAVLAGFEAACRIGSAVGPAHYRIWHNTATCGPFGAAMAGASLLALSDDAAMHALGNAGTQSSGLWEFMATGAMSKHLHAGRAAEAGLIAADLARHGFTGPPEILEGARGFFKATCTDARPDLVLADPDAPWALTRTSIKPWPSCRHTHPSIDAALRLSARIGNRRVAAASVETYQAALDVCDRARPQTAYEAKFSLQHCVAAALSGAAMDFSTFEAPARAAYSDLALRVNVAAGGPFRSAYPLAWGGRVTVSLSDGTKLSEESPHAPGDPEAPLSDAAFLDKTRMLLAHGSVGDADAVIDAILALAEDGPLPPLHFAGPV